MDMIVCDLQFLGEVLEELQFLSEVLEELGQDEVIAVCVNLQYVLKCFRKLCMCCFFRKLDGMQFLNVTIFFMKTRRYPENK
jgi:hypothetical protein